MLLKEIRFNGFLFTLFFSKATVGYWPTAVLSLHLIFALIKRPLCAKQETVKQGEKPLLVERFTSPFGQ